MLELLVWALPFSYGVFLNHYTSHHLFDGPQDFLLPLVGTLSSGIIYLTSIAIMPALSRYPHQRQNLMRFGAVLCVTSLLGAAFATEVWHLILTQGVLYSVGGSKLDPLWNCTSFTSHPYSSNPLLPRTDLSFRMV